MKEEGERPSQLNGDLMLALEEVTIYTYAVRIQVGETDSRDYISRRLHPFKAPRGPAKRRGSTRGCEGTRKVTHDIHELLVSEVDPAVVVVVGALEGCRSRRSTRLGARSRLARRLTLGQLAYRDAAADLWSIHRVSSVNEGDHKAPKAYEAICASGFGISERLRGERLKRR